MKNTFSILFSCFLVANMMVHASEAVAADDNSDAATLPLCKTKAPQDTAKVGLTGAGNLIFGNLLCQVTP